MSNWGEVVDSGWTGRHDIYYREVFTVCPSPLTITITMWKRAGLLVEYDFIHLKADTEEASRRWQYLCLIGAYLCLAAAFRIDEAYIARFYLLPICLLEAAGRTIEFTPST